MPRFRATIEYDGGPYAGFQVQANAPSVQGELERAITAFTGEAVRLGAAGRTDSGVHATGQVVHFDLTRDWTGRAVRDAMNAHLAEAPISVVEAEPVDDDFHARFSAKGRRYLYRAVNRRARPALERDRVWWVKGPLELAPMQAAAARLVGLHDFTTFRDAHCQSNSPVKTLDAAEVSASGEEFHFVFAARSFLHRQVRSMVGALVHVGLGRWTPDDLAAAMAAADRTRCPPVAPAHGLYLTGVDY